jgi:4-amino-4-deoxy-L-arabinose transferase-like glycosyltransferase
VIARNRMTWLALAGLLGLGLLLRLWNIDHDLPFVYNADEELHFVPKAVAMLDGSLNPHYFENPPALTYLLFVFYKVGLGAGHRFELARIVVALIGTGVIGLVYWAAWQVSARRAAAVLAAAVMAVAFLPVFYSKHALNDTVTMAPVTVGLVGCLWVYRRGRTWDWVLAGAAIGVACAVKYTAGALLIMLFIAAALRVYDDRSQLRRAIIGLVIGGACFLVAFAILNPFGVLHPGELRSQVSGQSSQAGTAKLGQDELPGWWYYLGSLTWGLGWVPLVAAIGGGVALLRRNWRLGLLLVVFPVVFWLYMSTQTRHFGRWLMPVYPTLCILAGIGAVALIDRLRWKPAILTGLFAVLLCGQGLAYSVHIDRVFGRTDTRTEARRWMLKHIPAGSKIVVEPFIPANWTPKRYERWPVERPYQAYEKRLTPELVDQYRAGGFCWVVVGSHQKDRGLSAGLGNAYSYYQALDAASAKTVTFSPYSKGAGPVRFSYDDSFNYRPLAYHRPGPVVEIHHLTDCA